MRLVGLYFYFVLALYLGTHATGANVRFSLLGATDSTYRQFIVDLRAVLTVRAPRVYDIPVLQSSAAGAARFLLVDLTNYNSESITLALDVLNVYVIAYQARNTAYFLNDASTEAFSVLFRGIKQQRLPYGGNYDGLETAAGRVSRQVIDLGFSEMSSAIGNMFHHNAGTSVPRAFLVLIQSVSEAARFKYISQKISQNVRTKFRPDPGFISLQNSWGSLSEQIQIAQNRKGQFARAVEVRSVSNKPVLVTNVSSPVIQGVALLLYYRPRVAIDNVILMSLSTY